MISTFTFHGRVSSFPCSETSRVLSFTTARICGSSMIYRWVSNRSSALSPFQEQMLVLNTTRAQFFLLCSIGQTICHTGDGKNSRLNMESAKCSLNIGNMDLTMHGQVGDDTIVRMW